MNSVRLSQAVEGFILNKSAKGLSPNTIRNYKKELARFIEWSSDEQITKISSQIIENYFKFLREDFRICFVATTPIKPKKLSNKSIRNVWGTFSSFWKWASKEFLFNNPFNLPPIRAYTKPINPLSNPEIEKLLSVCELSAKNPYQRKAYTSRRNTGRRDKAIILTLLDTGLRVSELCGINIGDLDLDKGRLLVTGKGEKPRYVYLGKISKQAIWRYLIERNPENKSPDDEPVFISRDGIYRMTRQGVLLLVKRLGLKAGISNVHPHRFRHTFAIQFLRNGGNVFELQNLLGHSDLDMVKHYVRLAQVDLEQVARKASPVDNWHLK